MPASRLMTNACTVSITTASIKMTSCIGWVRMPSEMMSVVAPAGGCGDFNSTISPDVSPSESAAAMTRGPVTPTGYAGPAIVSPVTTRLKYPANTPIA